MAYVNVDIDLCDISTDELIEEFYSRHIHLELTPTERRELVNFILEDKPPLIGEELVDLDPDLKELLEAIYYARNNKQPYDHLVEKLIWQELGRM